MTDNPVSPGSGRYSRQPQPRGGPLSRRDFVLTSAGILIPASAALAMQNTSIRISVTGLSSTATTGGTAVVTRTDISGQAPVTAQVSSSGSARVNCPPGTYSVQYTPPSGYVLASGTRNPQTTQPGSGRTGQVSFSIQAQVVATTTTTTTQTTTQTSSGGFATPDVLNNASFETGWENFTNGGSSAPTGLTRDTQHAYDGIYSVMKQLPVTSGTDYSSAFYYMISSATYGVGQSFDRLWGRFYFYFDAAMTGTLKLQRWEDPTYSALLGGFFCTGGNIGWGFDREWSAVITPLVALSSLVNGWHSLECDYWRNGDPSGYPSVAIWLDGNQLNGGLQSPPSPGAWTNGRLNAGQRGSSAQLGVYFLLNVLNGTPNNTVAGNVWVDRVAVSSLGRIGP